MISLWDEPLDHLRSERARWVLALLCESTRRKIDIILQMTGLDESVAQSIRPFQRCNLLQDIQAQQ